MKYPIRRGASSRRILDASKDRMKGLATIAVVVLLAGAAGAAMVGYKLSRSAELVKKSSAYQQNPPRPTAKILVAGDSTGVGTGASSPEDSVSGRLGRDHPNWSIENRSVNGAKYEDVIEQLSSLDSVTYDAIIIFAGGNDVIRSTDPIKLDQEVDRALTLADAHSKNVIIQPSGNVGNTTLFPWPFSLGMTKRSEELHAIVRKRAAQHGAAYVNLFKDKNTDPFSKDPDRLNAADGLHPSSDGYAIWYAELTTQAAAALAKIPR